MEFPAKMILQHLWLGAYKCAIQFIFLRKTIQGLLTELREDIDRDAPPFARKIAGMVTSEVGKPFTFAGFESLREVFIMKLLPDRKLKTLLQCPLNELLDKKKAVIHFYYSGMSVVISLEEASRDMLHALKDKALKVRTLAERARTKLD